MGFGLLSIILADQGFVPWAAVCILVCVVLDSLDGFLARKLATDSLFGMQLDSLADIVNFGVTPVFLVWQHLQNRGGAFLWIVPFYLVQVCSGAFRLARFNLQPRKQSSQEESLGLTITQAGLITTLFVLADLSIKSGSIPIWIFALLSVFVSYLMVSKIVLVWHTPTKSTFIAYAALGGGLLFFSSFYSMLLVLYLGGLVISISKFLITKHRGVPNPPE